MQSAGQLLRTERLRRNQSLADIASETRISSRYLEAIEQDDISRLPGDFFYKAFLRQYAKALQLDSAETDRILAAAVPTQDVDPVPVLNEVYANASTGESSRWRPSTSVATVALILVLASGSGLYAWWQRLQTAKEQLPEQTDASPVPSPPAAGADSTKAREGPAFGSSAQEPVKQEPVKDVPADPRSAETQGPAMEQHASAELQPTPALPGQLSGAATPRSTAPAESGLMTLELVATEPTWVQLTSGARNVYIGTLQPAETRRFEVEDNSRLLTGNAGTLDVRLNGKPLGAIGPRGQVRTVVFSSDSFQITPLKPRVPPNGEDAAPRGVANRLTTGER